MTEPGESPRARKNQEAPNVQEAATTQKQCLQ